MLVALNEISRGEMVKGFDCRRVKTLATARRVEDRQLRKDGGGVQVPSGPRKQGLTH